VPLDHDRLTVLDQVEQLRELGLGAVDADVIYQVSPYFGLNATRAHADDEDVAHAFHGVDTTDQSAILNVEALLLHC
jgi:hypothetical protein